MQGDGYCMRQSAKSFHAKLAKVYHEHYKQPWFTPSFQSFTCCTTDHVPGAELPKAPRLTKDTPI